MTCNLEIKKGVHSNFIMISPVSTCTFKSRTNRNSVDTLSFLALPCLNGWVSYQEKCYFFSEHTDSWFGASVSIVQLYLHHHHLFLRRNHHHQHNHHHHHHHRRRRRLLLLLMVSQTPPPQAQYYLTPLFSFHKMRSIL